MKVLPFTLPTVIANTMIGLMFLGITIPPFKVTTTHHDQSAADNTKDVAGFQPDATLFLPGAPVAALNDHQRRYQTYTINRQLNLSSCEDSPLKVLTTKKIKSAKTCAFIRKKPKQRCKRDAIKSHCPIACRSCESFETSDSEGTFLFEGAKTTCAWLHDRTLAEASYWCQLDLLHAMCRKTCGFFCDDEPEQSNPPSLSPTTCSDKITSIIKEHFDDVVKGPPQEQAYTWLVEDITDDECDDEAMIMQRYILAVLYFSTGGDDWDDWSRRGWLESKSECNWEGVECNYNQQVMKVDLGWNNRNGILNGTIPTELGSLSNLEWLDLRDNSLSGSIPGSIFQLPKLEDLELYYNYLTGKIPDNFGGSTSLKYIFLEDNLLTGTIPDVTGDSLQSIENLVLYMNKMSGPVPDSICALRSSKPNQFQWLLADCAPPDNAQNPCPSGCCTECFVGKGLP